MRSLLYTHTHSLLTPSFLAGIYWTVAAPTHGWCAIGINTENLMLDSDIWWMAVTTNSSGQYTQLYDRRADPAARVPPPLDVQIGGVDDWYDLLL